MSEAPDIKVMDSTPTHAPLRADEIEAIETLNGWRWRFVGLMALCILMLGIILLQAVWIVHLLKP